MLWNCVSDPIASQQFYSALKSSARFFTFNFTHYSSYKKDETVLGTTKTSGEGVLEKLHWWLAQVRNNVKLKNTVKSLISGHSKRRLSLINGYIVFLESLFTKQTHMFDTQKGRHLYLISGWKFFPNSDH